MTQIIANRPAPDSIGLQDADWESRLKTIAADPRMSEDNTTLLASSARKIAMPLMLLGLVGIVVTVIGAFSISLRHALGAFEVGVFTALAIALGSLFWVLVFHSLNASWPITLRRPSTTISSKSKRRTSTQHSS